MPAVEGIALAIGIAGGALGLSTIAVVLCTAVTVIREGKVSVLVGSIWSTAFCACMAGTCTALQWVYPWAPSQARACETLAGVVGFFYTCTIGSVLQFLHCRALMVDDQARSTPLMKMIQLGIVSVVPFAIFTAAVSQGRVVDDLGVCVGYYPVYVAVLIVMAVVGFSALLIYKFTTSLREHQARMALPNEKLSAGDQTRNKRMETLARRNLFFSSIALGSTLSTMTYLLIDDLAYPTFAPLHMAIVNLIGIVDVAINCLVICTCSNAWIPRAFKVHPASQKYGSTRADP